MAKVAVYRVRNDAKHVDALGAQGWEIVMKSPIIIGKRFRIPTDATITKQFVDWLNVRINRGAKERKYLISLGYKVKRVYRDSIGERVYVFEDLEQSPLYDWRLEFDYGEQEPVAYITFGAPDMNVPAFAKKDVIDKYVPKEIIEQAISSGSLYEDEIETEEPEQDAKGN